MAAAKAKKPAAKKAAPAKKPAAKKKKK